MKFYRVLIVAIVSLVISYKSYSQNDKNKFDSLLQMIDEYEANYDTNLYAIYQQLTKYSPNPDVSIFYGKKAIDVASQMQNKEALAGAHLTVSNPIRRKGNLEDALKHALTALELYQELGNDRVIPTCLNVIGVVYYTLENYELSVNYLNRAVEMDKAADQLEKLANDYNNLGEAYRLWHRLDSALINFGKAYDIFKELNVDYGIAYSAGNIGLVYAEQGVYENAEAKINEATEIFEKQGNRYPIAVYKTYMADIYRDGGDMELALNNARESLKIGIDYKLKEQIRDANFKLAELYSEKNNYRKAFEHQSQYLIYRDSINSAETIRKMADLRTEFEVSQKQAEVDLLNQQQKTQEAIGWGMVSGLSLLGILAVVLYRNNQKKLRINKLLEDQKGQLQEMNNTKDKFFSIISHDLRGPVNSFKGISQIIKMYVNTKRTDQLIEVTEDIDKSVEGLSDLLDNLLNWAIQQQGQVPNVPEKVNLNELTEDLLNTFSNMAQAKEITLKSEIPDKIDLWADRNSTMTIMRNLVNNAIKFTRNGGEVRVSASQEGDHAIIKIKDTGVGMPEAKVKELFQLKASKRSWGTDGEKGLGLGLQLVDEFITMNQGSIKVESAEGKGTAFIIRLPLFESQPVEQVQKI